jgi:hypothetical protein
MGREILSDKTKNIGFVAEYLTAISTDDSNAFLPALARYGACSSAKVSRRNPHNEWCDDRSMRGDVKVAAARQRGFATQWLAVAERVVAFYYERGTAEKWILRPDKTKSASRSQERHSRLNGY